MSSIHTKSHRRDSHLSSSIQSRLKGSLLVDIKKLLKEYLLVSISRLSKDLQLVDINISTTTRVAMIQSTKAKKILVVHTLTI